MRHGYRVHVPRLAIAALFAVSAAACVDEKIVYRDAPRFQNPPAAAGKYLGYSDTATKVAACGSCHTGDQAKWVSTKHATAWASLQANPGKAAYCEACHSVGNYGSRDTTTGGFKTTRDKRYQDVQCENCHGPGLDHATNPTQANRPLASIIADTGKTGTCGQCHSGTHNPYLDDWKKSNHGTMAFSATPRKRAECQACHTGQGALAAFGVDARSNYREKNFANADTLKITCAVCHDPHGGTGIIGQLRFAVNSPDPEKNLCMKCHQRRGVPDTVSSQTSGPHSPEGPMVYGSAGWEPPGFDIPNTPATHGNLTANPRLCAGCHVNKKTITDSVGAFSYQYTGHRFLAIPCVDARGKPTDSQTCAETVTARDFASCAGSGCHASTTQAAAVLVNAEGTINILRGEVRRLLNLVPAGQIVNNTVYTVAEGARFNWLLASDSTTGGPVGGAAKTPSVVHNPGRLQGLLAASALALKAQYGIAIRADLVPLVDQQIKVQGIRVNATPVASTAAPNVSTTGSGSQHR